MDKNSWLAFLSSKIKSQISQEALEKAQNWALALFGFMALGFAFTAISAANSSNPSVLYGAKVLFLFFFHLYVTASFYIPSLLQKGQRPVGRFLQTRDFVSLAASASVLAFFAFVTAVLASQTSATTLDFEPTGFQKFVAWSNLGVSGFYFAGLLFYMGSLAAAPALLIKLIERGGKSAYAALGVHALLLVLTGISYNGITRIGGPDFFEQLRIAGLFWVFIGASVALTGRVMRESAIPALSALEMDLISGKLERMELVVPRFRDAFVGSRFESWLRRYAGDVAAKSGEIAKYSKEAEALVGVEKPSEIDLRQVEDRYRRAESLYKQIEKSHQRFMTSMVAFYLSEAETDKAAIVRDQFSRELRNAKLELATIRKRIDERLVSLKNTAFRMASSERQVIEELTLKP
jgi:hypothetical protein